MRIIHPLFSSAVLALIGAALMSVAHAAETTAQAKIVMINGTGTAEVVVDGQTQPASKGMFLPANAEVRTSTQEVYIEVAPGVVATVKTNSDVTVRGIDSAQPALDLRQGNLVTQIDKKRANAKPYRISTPKGVAAARGTSFTISAGTNGVSITTTADAVEFDSPAGHVTIQAGMVSFTPTGATSPLPAVPLSQAVQTNPEVAGIVRDAVATASTVVQNNLGSISADSATNILSQVVAVAVATIPTEATTFTSQAIAAVTAPGSATAGSADALATAAGSVTAAAVAADPEHAAEIAGAAAGAAPAQSGVITAAAQQVAPGAKDAITDRVAASTGQSTSAVQSSAESSSGAAAKAVETSKEATSNVVAPRPNAPSTPGSAPEKTSDKSNDKRTEKPDTTPVNQVDPAQNVSPAT